MSAFTHCPYDGSVLEPGGPSAGRGPRCVRCGYVDYQNPRPCVAILIVQDGCVLLARRGVEPAEGMWDIPGGFIDHGESAEDAVVREAFEETGLSVRVTSFLGSLPDVYGDRAWPTLNLAFRVEVVSGEMKAQGDVSELRWIPASGPPEEMAFAHQRHMLAWARASILGEGD